MVCVPDTRYDSLIEYSYLPRYNSETENNDTKKQKHLLEISYRNKIISFRQSLFIRETISDIESQIKIAEVPSYNEFGRKHDEYTAALNPKNQRNQIVNYLNQLNNIVGFQTTSVFGAAT